jgi:hypothetical protein
MVFKNEKQLEAFLLQKCKIALERSQNQVYKIIDLYLNRFYADYDPVMYERTYKLLHSLVKGNIVSTDNGYKAEVYFNLDYLYTTGAQPSGEDVMFEASHGGHGAKGLKVVNGGGEDAWFTPLEILDVEAIEILKNMLIAEGIPIK